MKCNVYLVPTCPAGRAGFAVITAPTQWEAIRQMLQASNHCSLFKMRRHILMDVDFAVGGVHVVGRMIVLGQTAKDMLAGRVPSVIRPVLQDDVFDYVNGGQPR